MKSLDLYDKTQWQAGEWYNEPDYVTLIDSDTSYPCVAKRNILGAWVGFVGLDEHHALFMIDSGAIEFDFVEVHNEGPTFTAFMPEESLQFSPPKKYWWVGFDCMHDTDRCPPPKDVEDIRRKNDTTSYKNIEYVLTQLQSLAYQLSAYDSRLYLDTHII